MANIAATDCFFLKTLAKLNPKSYLIVSIRDFDSRFYKRVRLQQHELDLSAVISVFGSASICI